MEALSPASLVRAFGEMNDDGRVRRRGPERLHDVRRQGQRMRPAIAADDSDWEAAGKYLGRVRIVMANGRYSGDEVLECAPPMPDRLGHFQMFKQGRAVRLVDVARPGFGIGIGTPAQPREETEFQVVVRVD